jgi:hypothetical protein
VEVRAEAYVLPGDVPEAALAFEQSACGAVLRFIQIPCLVRVGLELRLALLTIVQQVDLGVELGASRAMQHMRLRPPAGEDGEERAAP